MKFWRVGGVSQLSCSQLQVTGCDPKRVLDWLEARADEMADLLQRLIAIDTENPPGRGREACARLLQDAMADLGVPTTVDDPCVLRGSIGEGETVYYHGHFDVVPAQSRAQFAPR